MIYKILSRSFLLVSLFISATLVHALPALQLGPGADTGWSYDNSTQTWVLEGDGGLAAYANATTGNGSYAWDLAGAATQFGYLVVAATPNAVDATDLFDITVTNNGGALALFDSGFGTPPIEDPNSLANHSVFDTYFEIYRFSFDEAVGTIFNTQPDGIGGTGSGDGYTELFDITLNSADPGLVGLHFDLFSIAGDGLYDPSDNGDNKLVKAFAPFSHDAEMMVPEPGSLLLLGLGIFGLFSSRRAKLLM